MKKGDARDKLFGEAKRKKLNSLIKRETWKVVCVDVVPRNPNIPDGTFFLAIKDEVVISSVGKS